MTGREVARMAFELKEPPRLPVGLFAGGSWMVHRAGKTFAEIKEAPDRIAEVFIHAFERVGHDFLLTGSNFVNYPIHFLGCPIKDDSPRFSCPPGNSQSIVTRRSYAEYAEGHGQPDDAEYYPLPTHGRGSHRQENHGPDHPMGPVILRGANSGPGGGNDRHHWRP